MQALDAALDEQLPVLETARQELAKALQETSASAQTLEQDITDDVKSSDFGVVGGAAYHRGRLVIEGRYTFGFTDLDEDADVTVKNRSLSILAGWRF